jgi:DNA-binding MarR family transcriptional regulator
MKRSEAWKALREHGKWMRLSERAVFFALLERSDNGDCSIPAYMTPSLVQLAEAACCSKSTAAAALDHLEWCRWVERKRTRGGRSQKTAYQLIDGLPCAPNCEKRLPRRGDGGRRSQPSPKRSDSRTVYEEKRSDSRTPKRSDSHPQPRRSTGVSDEGIREGEEEEGSVASPQVRNAAAAASGGVANGQGRLPPDWTLIRQIVRIVHADPCGGIHREALAEQLRLPADGRAMRDALGIAYRTHKIDFCGRHVVKPINLTRRTAP